jgi:hypothetical protein
MFNSVVSIRHWRKKHTAIVLLFKFRICYTVLKMTSCTCVCMWRLYRACSTFVFYIKIRPIIVRVSLLGVCIPQKCFWLGSLRLGLCNGTARQSVRSIVTGAYLCCAYSWEMLFWKVIMSRACVELRSVLMDKKLKDTFSFLLCLFLCVSPSRWIPCFTYTVLIDLMTNCNFFTCFDHRHCLTLALCCDFLMSLPFEVRRCDLVMSAPTDAWNINGSQRR